MHYEKIILFLVFFIIFLLFYFQKIDNNDLFSKKTKDQSEELKNIKDILINNFIDNKSSIKERFDYIDKSFSDFNKIFFSSKRGILGNIYLNEILSLIFPKDKKFFQLEWTLKKKNQKGESLRVDAIIFGVNNENNLAIDSKFPLDNYLIMIDENENKIIREKAEKNFKIDLKKHVEKTSMYNSPIKDSIYQTIMFIPSDAIYLIINDIKFYEIIKFALDKKVWICSPSTLHIILNQIILANRNWELYKNSSNLLTIYLEINHEFNKFEKKWFEFVKIYENSMKKIDNLKITINKIIKKNQKLQNFENNDNEDILK